MGRIYKKNTKHHHIIIKYVKEKKLYCTHCQKYFIDKTVKVRDYVECPHCHQLSEVCGKNYYYKDFTQPVVLVQRMNRKVIIRCFEIYSYFQNSKSKKIKTSYTEYVRIIPGVGKFLGNNVFINLFGALKVYHGYKTISWYSYKGRKSFTNYPTYPYNKKRIVKGTNMEYAPIKEFLYRFSYYGYNFLDVLELAAYESFELLWNMKLYNLCFYSKALNRSGSFYKRFKVPKSFLKFMQDEDITYKELLLLQLFQKTDSKLFEKYRYININHIRYLVKNKVLDDFEKTGLELNYNNFNLIKDISGYVSLKKLMKYQKGLNNLNIYRDYLEMAKELSYNYKSKKDLFPRNLIARHDKMQTKIKVQRDMNTQFKAYIRYLELSKYTYSDDKYMIFPAPSIDSMIDEGTQQDNCVGHLYIDKYINGETEIFFGRELKNINKSLITLEYKNGQEVEKEKTINYNWYRYVYVYDISQTTGDEIPLERKQLEENDKEYFYEKLKDFSKYPVIEKNIEGSAEGYYIPKKEIVIQNSLSQNQKAAVLLHELSHAMYDDFDYSKDRDLSEFFVESIAFIVADNFGLDTSKCSFRYIIKWAKGEPKKIIELGNKIQKCANQFIKDIEEFEMQEYDSQLAA